jgi:hypothetical protein
MGVNLSELRIGRRDLRMISGMVMLCYLASHLANHALGLVSLDAAEFVLGGAVQFWGNPLVTVILYGAATVHVALAIVSVYERRTFRLPPVWRGDGSRGAGDRVRVRAQDVSSATFGVAPNSPRPLAPGDADRPCSHDAARI